MSHGRETRSKRVAAPKWGGAVGSAVQKDCILCCGLGRERDEESVAPMALAAKGAAPASGGAVVIGVW